MPFGSTDETGPILTSAAGIISLLDEPTDEAKVFALKRLNILVDNFWAEISEVINKIEILYEQDDFPERELSALLASKVYYHLGSFQDSLQFALCSGERFNVNESSEYVETIISKCIDYYTSLRVKRYEGRREEEPIDPKLESIVNRMFKRCFEDREYKQAIGIALETRRNDILQKAILDSDCVSEMLSYCLRVCLTFVDNHQFRHDVLRILVRLYQNLKVPDYISITQCCIFLDDPQTVAEILKKLSKGELEDTLMAYQIAFDLYESATQHFLTRILEILNTLLPQKKTTAVAAATATSASGEEMISAKDKEKEGTDQKDDDKTEDMEVTTAEQATDDDAAGEVAVSADKLEAPPEDDEPQWVCCMRQVITIIGGEVTIAIYQEFIIRNNHTDLQILKNTKEAGRTSICHNAVVISNGLMHCGTTSDNFLRDNLEWLKRATNWAKFTATASLGVIHQGHEKEALNLMSAYLPKDSTGSSVYSEGGGLYALGLIHANHGLAITDYLSKELRNNSNEVVRHGGCLGLGLAAMGNANEEVYSLLKENLFQDDAVIGEAAGIAMGLVMVGTRSSNAISDLLTYARETQHEKIQRGLALGIAMLMYGRLEQADTLIDDLSLDKDPLLRRAGAFTLGMAYCGSGNNKAIRKLLHIAVSDVDNDVRRAAVTSIGFLLFHTPEQCPTVVSLLSESYNPHVRCGAALALGIACAGTGNREALAIIEPMLDDPVTFVRQGVLVASALILIQHSEASHSKVSFYRQQYAKVIADKHEQSIAKFGAILAQGIIDAGGRNVTVSLKSCAGHTRMASVVGLLVFSQFWFWFPLCHFICLAFVPTAIIGLNTDLKMPKMQFKSNAKPSLYAYPTPLREEKEKEKAKVSTAILSVTAKAQAKSKKKEESAPPVESMEVDSEKKTEEPEKVEAAKLDEKATEKAADDSDKEKKEEPLFEMLDNPARAIPAQLKVISLPADSRYKPIKPIITGGIFLLLDSQKEEPEELIEPLQVNIPGKEDEEPEPEPPEPFEWHDEQ